MDITFAAYYLFGAYAPTALLVFDVATFFLVALGVAALATALRRKECA